MRKSARLQSSLYYARKRTRSLRAVPRLFRTHAIAPGATHTSPFTEEMLARPITLKTKINFNIAKPTELFAIGSNIVLNLASGGLVTLVWRGSTIASFTPPDTASPLGHWDLVVSLLPGNAQSRVWNQEGEVARNQISSPTFTTFADLSDDFTTSSLLIEPVSVYVAQLPRHFQPITEALSDEEDNLLLNSTALNFMIGWPTPFFEG